MQYKRGSLLRKGAKDMNKNRIEVRQQMYKSNAGQVNNEYHFWSDTGVYFGGLLFPSDGQYLFDDKTLDFITKALAIRWRLIQKK